MRVIASSLRVHSYIIQNEVTTLDMLKEYIVTLMVLMVDSVRELYTVIAAMERPYRVVAYVCDCGQ